MADKKPWEMDWGVNSAATPSSNSAANPWEMDWGSSAPKDNIIQEMHPNVSLKDRAIVKNFGADSQAITNYLQKQYPQLEVKKSNDNYLFRDRNKASNEPWNVLDPQTGFFSKDFLNDATDVGYDLASGAVQNTATAGAGLAGAAGGGLTALPLASAASSASGGALEALRQKLGNLAGIDQEVNMEDVGLSAGVGAVSPFLFGTGASAKQIGALAKNNFLSSQTGDIAKNLAKSQSGIPGRLFSNTSSSLMSAVSGIPKKTIESYSEFAPQVRALEKEGALGDFAEQFQSNLVSTMAREKSKGGALLGQTLEDAGRGINISEAKQEYKILEAEAKKLAKELKTPAVKKELADIRRQFSDLFTQKTIKKITVAGDTPAPVGKFGSPLVNDIMSGVEDPSLINKAKEMSSEFYPSPESFSSKVISKPVKKELGDIVSPKAALKLQDLLSDLAELHKVNAGPTARFSSGATRAEKQMQEAARRGYNAINKEFESATGGVSKQLKDEYARYSNLQKALKGKFSTPERTFQTLTNINSPGNTLTYGALANLDKELGTKIVDQAKIIDALSKFSPGSFTPLSGGGVTSTSRSIPLGAAGGLAGAVLGSQSGEGYGGTMLGGGVGALAGAYVGGPRAIRFYLDQAKKVEKPVNLFKKVSRMAVIPASKVIQTRSQQNKNPWEGVR